MQEMIKMKKSIIVAVAIGVVGLFLVGTAIATVAENGNGSGHFQWAKNLLKKFMHRHHVRQQIRERAMENMTEVSGILYFENGSYYIDGFMISFGPEWFLENRTARSDYDRDGTYETIKEELEGLEGTDVTIMGILRNDTILAFYIDGIWYRNPVRMPQEISEISGILEYDGEYTINNQTIFFGSMRMLFHKVAKSDYDRDGQLESMYYELDGLLGTEVTLDGFYKGDVFVPFHINGIWYRPMLVHL